MASLLAEVRAERKDSLIPTRTERHALAQSRRPMGMTRYSLRSENPGMSQPSRGLVLNSCFPPSIQEPGQAKRPSVNQRKILSVAFSSLPRPSSRER